MKAIKKTFGLVFQNFNLFPHYTVIKNITDAPISVDKLSKVEALERARSNNDASRCALVQFHNRRSQFIK